MLLIFTIFAFVQLLVMFSATDEPLIWTSPSLLWLVYLVLEEPGANMVAMALPVIYLVCYLLSKQRRGFIALAAIFFAIDTFALYVFAISSVYFFDLYELGIPLFFLYFLVKGAIAWTTLRDIPEDKFNRAKQIVIEQNKRNAERAAESGGGGGFFFGGGGGGGFGG